MAETTDLSPWWRRLMRSLRQLKCNPPAWLRWIELFAIGVGVAAVLYEFWIQIPADRELQNVRLHAMVASLSDQPQKETTSYAVRKILGLMRRNEVDMTGISFPGSVFRMADVDQENRKGAFHGIDWSDAYMNEVEFSCSRLITDLHKLPIFLALIPPRSVGPKSDYCVDLRHASFDGASLQNIYFRRTNLSHATFSAARLAGLRAENVNFSHARFVKDLESLSFLSVYHLPLFNCGKTESSTNRCVNLTDVRFLEADLRYAVFVGATISGADFTDANLEKAEFRDKTTIDRACFQGTVLTSAKFTGVKISHADFSDANLSNAEFENVTFNNVVFPTAQKEMAGFDDDSLRTLHAAQVEPSETDQHPCGLPSRM